MRSLLRNAARGAGISGGWAELSSMVVNAANARRTTQPSHRPVVWSHIDPPGERRVRPSPHNAAGGPWATRIPQRVGSQLCRIGRCRRKKGYARHPEIRPQVRNLRKFPQIFRLGCPEWAKNDVRAASSIGHFKRRILGPPPPFPPRHLPKESKSGGISRRASWMDLLAGEPYASPPSLCCALLFLFRFPDSPSISALLLLIDRSRIVPPNVISSLDRFAFASFQNAWIFAFISSPLHLLGRAFLRFAYAQPF